MTIDECLETVSVDVRQAICQVADKAGTWDADWAVLKAAGEIIAKLQMQNRQAREYASRAAMRDSD